MDKGKERENKLINALIDLLLDKCYLGDAGELATDLINECGFTAEELVNAYKFDKATVDEALDFIKEEK